MATKLSIYNAALIQIGKKRIASLSEHRDERLTLDQLWDQEVAYCLERKFWNFMYRVVSIDASDTVVPEFGFAYAFQIPDDWIRTRKLSAVETLDPPLLKYTEETGWWFANVTPLYVEYNSRDPQYGMNLGNWPASFTDYVGKRLARQACASIAGDEKAPGLLQGPQGLIRQEEKAYKVAAANCAMNEAVGFPPTSSWIRARRGSGMGGDTPPSSGSLIG
jgi:hypothetical protein